MTEVKNNRGSSLLRDLLAARLQLDADYRLLEGKAHVLNGRIKQQQQRIQEATNVMQEAVQSVLEAMIVGVVKNEPQWNQQALVVQALPVSEEWWKIFFLKSDGKFVQVQQDKMPPGFFWSFDPDRQFKGPRSSDADGALVRWSDYLPALDAAQGLVGTVLINPITGEIQTTLTEPMELKVIENAPAAPGPGPDVPAPVAPAPAPVTPAPVEATPAPAAAPAEATPAA